MLRPLISFILSLWVLHTNAQQLVLPGDHPDPSVVKIDGTYWATATTSNWMPAYPLYRSKDLLNWKPAGNIFNTLPAWADYYFWAPEITYESGKIYVYYATHKKGGNLCIGIASADKPEGPYKDHGPIICQEVGSIDAFPVRDEKGKLHLIWKEDANSVSKPTPIWIQELNEERTKLMGQKKELFRNDAPWEGNLVEGVSMMKHGEYYYAFYAAGACCGAACNYNAGVARSKNLMGPWEKYDKNPIIINEGEWKCPGHGTPIEKDGRFYFIYHAYHKEESIYTGRQGLIKEFRFTPDGWIEFVSEAQKPVSIPKEMKDKFNGKNLSGEWQWSVFQKFNKQLKDGNLELSALPATGGAFIGQKTYSTNYEVLTEVNRNTSTATAGLVLIGDEKNLVGAYLKGNAVQLIQVKDGKEKLLSTHLVGGNKKGRLHMQVQDGKSIRFFYSQTKGSPKALNSQPIDGSYLPPWDRALRIGIAAKGAANQKAVFADFEVKYSPN
ncbi:MAG TPA: family 43 glycosylhydrolase [Flavisolibacter sp.]